MQTQQYGSLREKIRAESAARRQRYADFETLYARAHEAGHKAATECVPRGMIVGHPSTPFGNDVDLSQPHEYVADGVCGFAWIVIHPATCSFVKWLQKSGRVDRWSRHTGIWVSDYNQSMQRKEAYAHAFADVLRAAGINAYANSRMD